MLGAIQIIRDTLGASGSKQCHQMTQGEGGQPKCHVSFFSFIFELNFTIKFLKSYIFSKMKIVKSHQSKLYPDPTCLWCYGRGEVEARL